jgi:hypothetical protein
MRQHPFLNSPANERGHHEERERPMDTNPATERHTSSTKRSILATIAGAASVALLFGVFQAGQLTGSAARDDSAQTPSPSALASAAASPVTPPFKLTTPGTGASELAPPSKPTKKAPRPRAPKLSEMPTVPDLPFGSPPPLPDLPSSRKAPSGPSGVSAPDLPNIGPALPGPLASGPPAPAATPKPRRTPAPTPAPTPVDPAPVARDDYFQPNDLYKTYGFIDLLVFENDSDRGATFDDGSPFRTLSVVNGSHGNVEATSVLCDDSSGRYCVRYYPHHIGPFRDTFTYRIVDAAGNTARGTVTIDVP